MNTFDIAKCDNKPTLRMFPIMSGPAIPWAVIAPCEKQADRNHGQTLERLAERGGLCPSEAVAVLDSRKWCPMDLEVSLRRLEEIVKERFYLVEIQTITRDRDELSRKVADLITYNNQARENAQLLEGGLSLLRTQIEVEQSKVVRCVEGLKKTVVSLDTLNTFHRHSAAWNLVNSSQALEEGKKLLATLPATENLVARVRELEDFQRTEPLKREELVSLRDSNKQMWNLIADYMKPPASSKEVKAAFDEMEKWWKSEQAIDQARENTTK